MALVEYIYTKEVNYAEQLVDYIKLTFPNVDSVSIDKPDTVHVYFPSALSSQDETTLENLVAAFVNPSTAPVYTMHTHRLDVSPHGMTDFTHIEPAVAYAITLLPSYINIYVEPDTYILTETLVVPSGINIISDGAASGTVFRYATVGATVMQVSGDCYIEGICIDGGGAANTIGIEHDGTVFGASVIQRCTIVGCAVGARTTEGPNALYMMVVGIGGPLTNHVDTGIEVLDGGYCVCIQSSIVGYTSNMSIAVKVSGSNASTTVPSTLNLSTLSIMLADIGLVIDGGMCFIHNTETRYLGTAVKLLSNGTPNSVFNDVTIRDSVDWDFDIQSTSVSNTVISTNGCSIHRDKIRNVNNIPLLWQFVSTVPFQEKHVITGTINVGDHVTPSRMVIGRGEANFHEMAITSNSDGEAGTWVNLKPSAVTNSTFDVWQSAIAGNCLYVGHVSTFAGLKVNLVTSNTGNAANTWEYWNGSTWTSFKIMAIKAGVPWTNHGSKVFRNDPGDYYVFFGMVQDWATKALNGTTMYWMRLRVTEASTTVAQSKGITPILDSTMIEQDGFTLRFGRSRTMRISGFEAKTSWHSQKFLYTQDTSYGTTVVLPSGIDTSHPVKLIWCWLIPSGTITGTVDVKWSVRYAAIPEGASMSLDASNLITSAFDQTVTTVSSVVNSDVGKHLRTTVDLDLSNTTPGSDLLAIKITRLGTDNADTLDLDIQLLNCYMKYLSYIDGSPTYGYY